MQVVPSKELSKIVRNYLFIESNTKGIKTFRFFSDGNTGIVFSFKNRLFTGFSNSANPDYLPYSFIYGQLGAFKDVFCHDETSLLVVVFHPFGMNQLLRIPSDILVDEIIDLDYIFGRAGQEVTEKLLSSASNHDRIKIVETFLLHLFSGNHFSVQPIIIASLDLISKNNGLINVGELVQYTGYNKRHIERKFMEVVGISPKQYSNIIKLNVFLKSLKENANKSKLIDIGYQAGYYDQSHLIKDFKKITGITPTQYISNFFPLTINLLEAPVPFKP